MNSLQLLLVRKLRHGTFCLRQAVVCIHISAASLSLCGGHAATGGQLDSAITQLLEQTPLYLDGYVSGKFKTPAELQ
jgi:hypothetical protein